jgi:hypothetical protein
VASRRVDGTPETDTVGELGAEELDDESVLVDVWFSSYCAGTSSDGLRVALNWPLAEVSLSSLSLSISA